MIYLKSVLVGLIAVTIAVIVAAAAIVAILAIEGRHLPPGEAYGWDPVTFFQNSLVAWVILGFAFVIGFVWEYRRAMTRQQ